MDDKIFEDDRKATGTEYEKYWITFILHSRYFQGHDIDYKIFSPSNGWSKTSSKQQTFFYCVTDTVIILPNDTIK